MFALDFFCGAGGLTRGFLNVGIKVVAGIDVDEGCRRTYEENNAPARFVACDLREMTRQDVAALVDGIPPDLLVFAACAPCQPFSKQRRVVGDRRDRTLLGAFSALVAEFRPRFVVVENVPGIVRVPGNSTYRRLLSRLESLGYSVAEGRSDSKFFGVPQTRCRWLVLAALGVQAALPPRTHGPGGLPYCTVREAIYGYPRIQAGSTDPTVPNHRAAGLSDLNLRRLRATPQDGGGRLHWPRSLALPCHSENYDGHTDVYGRMRWDAPAPALTCRCVSLSNGRYGHPEQDRAISVREAARLQSFEDDFIFYGPSMGALAAQIGNAVPVKLGEAIGEQILRLAGVGAREARLQEDHSFAP
ncbi:MAG: DNA cytosine methyltransferase [Acidobacteriota bacterium]